MADPTDAAADSNGRSEASADLLKELVAHLSANRTNLRQEWARRIGEARLLTALTQEEIFSEATSVYDNYVEVLETGSVEALQDYARNLSERIIPRGVETDEVLGIVLLLRDVLARSLFQKYQTDFDYLNQVLDAAGNDALGEVARVVLERLDRAGLEHLDIVVVHRRRFGEDLLLRQSGQQPRLADPPRPLLPQLRAVVAKVGDQLGEQVGAGFPVSVRGVGRFSHRCPP